MTLTEAAEAVERDADELWSAIEAGVLPAVEIGGRWRVRLSDVMDTGKP